MEGKLKECPHCGAKACQPGLETAPGVYDYVECSKRRHSFPELWNQRFMPECVRDVIAWRLQATRLDGLLDPGPIDHIIAAICAYYGPVEV